MNISNIYTQATNTNFQAKKVAVAKNVLKGKTTKIDIYKLELSDNTFLDKLKQRVDFQQLYTRWTEPQKQRVQQIFDFCVESSKNNDIEAFIEVSRNKICGIMSTVKIGKSRMLDAICTIPTSIDKNEVYAGKTLFMHLFEMAQKERVNKIELEAVIDSPSNVVPKYKKLGFKSIGEGEKYMLMRSNKYNIKDQLEKFDKIIKYKSINDDTHYNMEAFLNEVSSK